MENLFPPAPEAGQLQGIRGSIATVSPLVCIECRRSWLIERERWRLKVTDDDMPETVPYCPSCAEREFGLPR
jgi:NAD-dependent SIR2 family protein deacetylase